MLINVIYDQNPNTLPVGFTTVVAAAVQFFETEFTNPITINLHVGYGEVQGLPLSPGNLGSSLVTSIFSSYSAVRGAFVAHATSSDDMTAVGTLPNTILSGINVLVAPPEAAALGLIPSTTPIDAYVGFGNSANFSYDLVNNLLNGAPPPGQIDFFGTVAHEISEVMGRTLRVGEIVSGLPSYTPLDAFHYASPGVLAQVPGGYFSLDGGVTVLDNFNTQPGGDFGDWSAAAGHDSFLAFANPSVLNPVTETDLRLMDVIGYTRSPSAVTSAHIQNDALGIIRMPGPADVASAVANLIVAGVVTEDQLVNVLLSDAANTTVPAVAVEGSMYNAVGTSAEITLLATQFLPPQIANATKFGFNTQVYASEALGLAFAFGNENNSSAFANNFGPSNVSMPNTTAGDVAFAAAAAGAIFGSASTTNLANALNGFVVNWKAFYSSHGVPGIANATPVQIDLAARGTAWGDAVGVALANNIGPLSAQTINFLEDAAQGTAVYSASLASQPNHQPFNTGAAALAGNIMDVPVNLTGVASQLDHSVI
jgi:hypothetical protein